MSEAVVVIKYIDIEVLKTVSDTSPVPALTVEPVCSDASDVVLETFRANEPAMPVSPPLAPDSALAANELSVSPVSFMVADTLIPVAVTAAPVFTRARFVIVATLIATAIPTAVPVLPVDAVPSAIACASMLLDAASVNAPPPTPSSSAMMVTPPGISAMALLVEMFSASDAATDTDPPEPSSADWPLESSPSPDFELAIAVVDAF